MSFAAEFQFTIFKHSIHDFKVWFIMSNNSIKDSYYLVEVAKLPSLTLHFILLNFLSLC